jgi:ribosome-associated protein
VIDEQALSMLLINRRLSIPLREIDFSAIRAQGAGGQNVNKVSSAIHLRFNIQASSLPPEVKERLLAAQDGRISSGGVVVIKAQNHRTQELNRQEALERLQQLVLEASRVPKKRVATKPTKGSVKRRLDTKKQQSSTKKMRGRVSHD